MLQNICVTQAIDAERYYKVMVDGSEESWNIRDRHMQDTLERLVDFYGPNSKAIIWEHNTHIGDATATDMAASGLVNIGQVRSLDFLDGGSGLIQCMT